MKKAIKMLLSHVIVFAVGVVTGAFYMALVSPKSDDDIDYGDYDDFEEVEDHPFEENLEESTTVDVEIEADPKDAVDVNVAVEESE